MLPLRYFSRLRVSSSARPTRSVVLPGVLGALLLAACSSGPNEPLVDAASPDAPPDVTPDAGVPIDASPPPLFSHERGFYEEGFELVVTPDADDVEVYYTLDGRDPAGPTALPYSGPIAIDATTVARFAFKDGGEQVGETVTHTYLFPYLVPMQDAPAGYPTEWWNDHPMGPWPADYQMDPDIFMNSASSYMFPGTFYSIPAVSVAMDPDDLFGNDGIHENPWQEGDFWVRAGSFEMLKPDQQPSVQSECGVRIFGAIERDPERSPKQSFQVEFNGQFGPGSLDDSLYDDNGVSQFATLVLRAGYNRSWIHSSESQRERAQYTHEQFAVDRQRAMGHLAPRARLAHLFLNGLYWGLYLVQERPDGHFQAAHNGGAAGEYDVLDAGVVVAGDRVAWNQMMALVEAGVSTSGAYQSLAQMLDLENFADYVLLQHYLGNEDWPGDNWYAARHKTGDGLFRFFVWDAEETLGDEDDDIIAVDEADSPARIFQKLRENSEFLMYFADRINKHVANGGILTQSRGLELQEELWDEAGPAVFGESARWGDHLRDVRGVPDADLYGYDPFWLEEVERLEEDYLPFRSGIVIEQYRDAGIFPLVDAPLLFRQGGEVPAGFQLFLLGDGPDRNVFYTLSGSDPRLPGGAVSGSALIYGGAITIDGPVTLKARARLSTGVWSALTEATFTIE